VFRQYLKFERFFDSFPGRESGLPAASVPSAMTLRASLLDIFIINPSICMKPLRYNYARKIE
jgi:hypothetical protein